MHTSTTASRRPKIAKRMGLSVDRDWAEVLYGDALGSLVTALREWLPTRRWFRSKARTIQSIQIREQIAVSVAPQWG